MGDYNLNLFNPFVQDKNAVVPGVYSYNHGGKTVNVLTVQDEKASASSVYSYDDGGKTVNVLTVQDGLTTIKQKEDGYANNYDHFTYSPELAPFLGVWVEPIDAVRKYCGGDFSYYREKISDHLPILMKINI